jgi:crotonobetainyl-CoA:carnitine CoA-transferase CaiB-like acyl-CoA transferase
MHMPSAAEAILKGIRVVDLTQEVAGPLAARILAEMGADVVHVEPLRGDNGRYSTTPYLGSEGIFHQISNRSKRSLAVDIHTPKGTAILERLIAATDVVIDGMRPGSFANRGFDYERISSLNPRAIYVSLTGYGGRGPLQDRQGYDVILQGFTGVMNVSPERIPSFLGFLFADPAAPLLACIAVLGALMAREKSGHGQTIDVSLLDGIVHMISTSLLWVEDDEELSSATMHKGQRDPTTGVFEAAESTWLILAAYNDAQFRRLFDAIGLSELGSSARYATRLLRAAAADEISGLVSGIMMTRRAEEWDAIFLEKGVPCSVVRLDRRELLSEDQLWKNEMLVEVVHPTKGRMIQPGVGFRLSESPLGVRNPAPLLGQDSRAVLAELGYSAGEIEQVIEKGIVKATEI